MSRDSGEGGKGLGIILFCISFVLIKPKEGYQNTRAACPLAAVVGGVSVCCLGLCSLKVFSGFNPA